MGQTHMVSNTKSLDNYFNLQYITNCYPSLYINRETTLVQYKAALHEWNKGTGGGSGVATAFEQWDESKLDKYSVDIDDYDHTNIASRPLILFDLYTKGSEPYLTVI